MAKEQLMAHVPAMIMLFLAFIFPEKTNLLFFLVVCSYVSIISLYFAPKDENSKQTKSQEEVLSDFLVGVDQFRFHQGKTQYQIRLKYQGTSWSVWRSYSEILEFHKRHPPKDPQKVPFPEKSGPLEFLFGGDKTLEFAENRRARLDKALRYTLAVKQDFEVVVSLNMDTKSGQSPTGLFLGVPPTVNLSGAQVGLSNEVLKEEALKGLTMGYAHISKIKGDGVAPWKLFNRSSAGVSLYFFEDGDQVNSAVTTNVGASPVDLLDFLIDVEERPNWDADFGGSTELQRMNLENDIVDIHGNEFKLLLLRVLHSKTKSPARLIVSNRDSVIVAMLSQRVRDGALALSIRSVDDKRAPPSGVGGYVRAEVHNSVTLFEPVPGDTNACVFTLAGETDLKAKIPKSFIRTFAPKKADQVATFGKLARERASRKPSTLKPLLD